MKVRGKYNIGKDNIDFAFVRFGKFNSNQKQKRHVSNCEEDDVTFHTAPTTKGFYAFPYKLQEFFLIGSITKTQKNLNSVKKNDDTNWKKVYRNNRHVFYKREGCIWHHLEIPRNEIIAESGAWVKTTMKTWHKALGKDKVQLGSSYWRSYGWNTSLIGYSKDHYEVFFDEKID